MSRLCRRFFRLASQVALDGSKHIGGKLDVHSFELVQGIHALFVCRVELARPSHENNARDGVVLVARPTKWTPHRHRRIDGHGCAFFGRFVFCESLVLAFFVANSPKSGGLEEMVKIRREPLFSSHFSGNVGDKKSAMSPASVLRVLSDVLCWCMRIIPEHQLSVVEDLATHTEDGKVEGERHPPKENDMHKEQMHIVLVRDQSREGSSVDVRGCIGVGAEVKVDGQEYRKRRQELRNSIEPDAVEHTDVGCRVDAAS